MASVAVEPFPMVYDLQPSPYQKSIQVTSSQSISFGSCHGKRLIQILGRIRDKNSSGGNTGITEPVKSLTLNVKR